MIDINGETCFSKIKETGFFRTNHYIPGKKQPYSGVGHLNHYRCKSLSEYIKKASNSSKGINWKMFANADKVIHYYFETPNKVT